MRLQLFTPGGAPVNAELAAGDALAGPEPGHGLRLNSSAVWLRFGDGPWVRTRYKSVQRAAGALAAILHMEDES